MPKLSRPRLELPHPPLGVLGAATAMALLAGFACASDSGSPLTPGLLPTPVDSAAPVAGPGPSGQVPALPPVPPEITAEACAGEGVFPGTTELRRLSNPEYTNSVADLLELGELTLDLVPDAEGINNGVSQQHTDKYLLAANLFAETARAQGKFSLACAAEGESCAATYLRDLGRVAFRRPMTEAEVASYVARFTLGAEGSGGFEEGLEWAVGRMLQSPHFLHRVELEGEGVAVGVPVPLNSHSVATRLSYFLWQTMPDAPLRLAADTGALADEAAVSAEVERMIASPKFDQTLRSFHDQWLGVNSVLQKQKVAEITPAWSANLKLDLVEEIERFVSHVYKSGGTFTDLLTAKYSFLSPELAQFYGVTHPGGEWPIVDVPNRFGLLTMAGFTAAHSSEIQSNLVKRGAWIREQLLCTPLPDPPTDLGEIVEPEAVDGQTTAEAFAAHREDPRCSTCHVAIDPLGLPFENYDEFGRYRTMDRGLPVDPSGELTLTQAAAVGVDPVVSGPEDFASKFAQLPDAQSCAVNQWVQYGIGREVEASGVDKCTVLKATQRFTDSQLNFKELITGLATSDAFRYRVGQ